MIENAGTPSTDEPQNKKLVAPHSFAKLANEESMAAFSQATGQTMPVKKMLNTESETAFNESQGGPILINIQSSSASKKQLSKGSSSVGESSSYFMDKMLP